MATRIGQILLEKNVISREDLEEAQRIQISGDESRGISPGDRLGCIIMKAGLAEPMEVVRALCEQRRIDDYILVSNYIISPCLVAEVPLEVAKKYSILPLVRLDEGSNEALLATDRRQERGAASELHSLLDFPVEFVEVSDPQFPKIIDRVYELMAERGVFSVRIGEILVREGLVTQDEVEWALKTARRSNTRIGRVLVEEGLVSERELYRALARNKNLPLAAASNILEDKTAAKVASRLSRTFAIFNEVVPYRIEGATLHVATSDADADTAPLLKTYDCREIALTMVTLSDMVALLRAFYSLNDEEARKKGLDCAVSSDDVELIDDVWEDAGAHSEITGEDLRKLRRQYEKLVSNLLYEAIRRRASDIHIENYENFVVVRLRIDGLLYDARTLRIDKSNVTGVVNVIKVLSDINIAERRLPQGGRFKKRTSAGEIFDFRVQVQPTLFGENVVIRLLNQTASIVPLEELGFATRHLERFIEAAKNPSGLILITGPTGSGKTTTLYSTLDLLRRDTTIKIVTIEDPIEYSLPRIQQSQTHDLIDYTFASATRAFLRQDPDVALVGEIRDEETARETIKLSQTGHLVFSTLHTNTAASAAGRMYVLGTDPELLAGELLVVAAQRLATKICPECKVTYRPERHILDIFYPEGAPKGVTFHRGAGCPKCEGLGHIGRVALAEFWFIDHDSRMLISERADEDTILSQALGKSLHPLMADALEKVHAGIVDISTLPTVLPLASLASTARLIQQKGLVRERREAAG